MTRSPVPVLVRRALARQAHAATPNAELLARFVANRDPEAFTELVERYAPLVWGACRRVLGNGPAAEDAFQGTFVTLARKAAVVRHPDRLPGWLYGVARRTALRHRFAAKPTTAVPDVPAATPSPLDQVSGTELVQAIEAAVERLPEKYRSPAVLCWFQDCSLDEAAGKLGLTKGQLWGRLRQARARLQRRLAHLGYAVPATLGAGFIVTAPASARMVTKAVEAGLAAPVESLAAGVLAASPAVKPAGLAALVAASVVGLVTLLPAGGPPPKDPPKADDPAPKAEAAAGPTADGIPLPAGAVHRFGNRQMRHPDGISAAVVSPDGKLLATVGNMTVIVWDLKTLTAKTVLRDVRVSPATGEGGRVAFLPDSKSLLVSVSSARYFGGGGGFGNVPPAELARVYDVETGQVKFALKGPIDFYVASWVAPGGKELMTFTRQGIRAFDIKDGKELRNTPHAIQFSSTPWVSPDANLVALGSRTGAGLTVIDAATGKEKYSTTGDTAIRAAISPDGKRLAVHDSGGKIRFHDLEEKKELYAIDHPSGKGATENRSGSLNFAKDGNTLYIGGPHGAIIRWNVKDNRRLPALGRHNTWSTVSVALSPDEKTLYSTAADKLIRRWDLTTGKELPLPDGYITQTVAVPLHDGKTMLVADHAGTIDYWDLATGKHVRQLQPPKSGGIDCVAVSADGRWLAGGRTVQDVQLWDLAAGKIDRLIPLVDKPDQGGGDHVKRVAFGPGDKVLYATSQKTGVSAFELPTGKKLWTVGGAGHLLAADPRGRWVAAGGGFTNEEVRWALLDAKTGAVSRQVDVPMGDPTQTDGMTIRYSPYLSDLAFLPDGSRLVTAHYDGTVRVWDPEAGKELGRMRVPASGWASLAVSPDGRWVGVGRADRKVTVFEVATLKEVLTLSGHDSSVRDVAFTRDGRGIVGNADLAPVLWDLAPKDLPAVDGAAGDVWDALATDDGAKAYRLVWALAKKPDVAVKLFGEKVKPADLVVDRAQFEKWVAALDSPQFRAREAAERSLLAAGLKVPAGWLRAALADARSDEVRARLGRVLAAREKPDPADWRLGRAAQVLTLAGTPEARAMLKAWEKAGAAKAGTSPP